MMSLLNFVPPAAENWTYTWRGFPVRVHEGSFTLRGCDPKETYRVHFLDAKNRLGASVTLSGKQVGEQPVTVRLERCGAAVVRVQDFLERPTRLQGTLSLVVTSGPSRFGSPSRVFAQGEVLAEELGPQHIDPVCHWTRDKEGNYTFPSLIPGATYRLSWLLPPAEFGSRDFTVRPGETLRLPTLTEPEPRKE
jgi:hypothetical protein